MKYKGAALHIDYACKITLFFVLVLSVSAHLNKVSQLDGIGCRMPMVFAAFFLAALSIIGIPPLGGSWSKFLLMAGAAENGMVLVILAWLIITDECMVSELMRGFYLPEKSPVHVEATCCYPATLPCFVWLFFNPWPFLSLINLMVMP